MAEQATPPEQPLWLTHMLQGMQVQMREQMSLIQTRTNQMLDRVDARTADPNATLPVLPVTQTIKPTVKAIDLNAAPPVPSVAKVAAKQTVKSKDEDLNNKKYTLEDVRKGVDPVQFIPKSLHTAKDLGIVDRYTQLMTMWDNLDNTLQRDIPIPSQIMSLDQFILVIQRNFPVWVRLANSRYRLQVIRENNKTRQRRYQDWYPRGRRLLGNPPNIKQEAVTKQDSLVDPGLANSAFKPLFESTANHTQPSDQATRRLTRAGLSGETCTSEVPRILPHWETEYSATLSLKAAQVCFCMGIMQKSYFHSIIGRGRPLPVSLYANCTFAFPRHHLNTSSPRQQDAGQDIVMREAATPIPNRAQRQRRLTTEVENLFHQSAAKDDPTTPHQNTSFRIGPRQGMPNSQPAVLDDSDVGVPISQEVLEGQLPRRQPNPYNERLPKDGARHEIGSLNARNLGARRGRGNFTTGRTGAAEARDSGARPEQGQNATERSREVAAQHTVRWHSIVEGDLGARNRNEAPEGYRKDTTGLDSTRRFPPRRSWLGYEKIEAPRIGSMGGGNESQGRMSQEDRFQHNESQGRLSQEDRFQRNESQGRMSQENRFQHNESQGRMSQENRFQHNAPRVEGDSGAKRWGGPNAYSEHGSQVRRGGAQSGRAGRPRTSRSVEGDEPRRRKRNKEAAGGNDYGGKTSVEEMYNEKEKEYVKQKRNREATNSTAYEPGDVSRETFSGVGPAVVSGEWGMREVLGERLLLAKKYLDGDYVEWHSKEQKADVMTLVETLKHGKKLNPSPSLSVEAEQQTQNLMQKLLGGKYEFTKPQQGKDILGNVARHTDRNESYYPVDQQSLLEKVKSLVPAVDIRKDKRV